MLEIGTCFTSVFIETQLGASVYRALDYLLTIATSHGNGGTNLKTDFSRKLFSLFFIFSLYLWNPLARSFAKIYHLLFLNVIG